MSGAFIVVFPVREYPIPKTVPFRMPAGRFPEDCKVAVRENQKCSLIYP